MRTSKLFECPTCGIGVPTTYSKKVNDSFTVRRHKCTCCETMWVVLYEDGDIYKTLGSYSPKKNMTSLKTFLKNA